MTFFLSRQVLNMQDHSWQIYTIAKVISDDTVTKKEVDFNQNQFFLSYLKTLRNSRPQVLCKNLFLKILQNSQENICERVSFLI